MNFASDIVQLYVVIAITFAGINSLLFIPWRKSFKFMSGIAAIFIAIITLSLCYFYLFTDIQFSLLIKLVDVIWFMAAFCFAQYRDSRTLFSMLSVWLFCFASSILAYIACVNISSIIGQILITIAIHIMFSVCVFLYVRKTFFSIMNLGKKGWLYVCLILILPFILLRMVSLYPISLGENPHNIPIVILTSVTIFVLYIVFAKFAEYFLLQKERQKSLDLIASHIYKTEEKLKEATQHEAQNAILRHDLRHFAGVIASCIQNNLYDEALASTQSLLTHPAMLDPEIRYCKNSTLNALLCSYVQRANEKKIDFQTSIALEENVCVTTMDLAVLLSNTLENAINACDKQADTSNRKLILKLYTAGEQLFVSISNSCDTYVNINPDTGLPYPNPQSTGQGVGLLSVQAFIQKYNAHVDCSQEDDLFQMRIVASAPTVEKKPPQKFSRPQTSILRVNFIITLLIVTGFLLACVTSYISFNNLFKTDIASVSELTSKNIHANVSNLMDRPINISLAMSHDTLLRELMRQEAEFGVTPEMTEVIQDYLLSYQKKYDFDSVALTSVKTGAYYHFQNGVARYMSPNNPEDKWFYDILNDPVECKMNIDNDKIKNYMVTIFADTKLLDDDGTILGVIGIGMKTPYIQELLVESEKDHHVEAFLIDETGNIQLSSNATELEGINLFDNPMFSSMKDAIVQNKTTTEKKWYSDGRVDGYIITKYIPDLNWYLVVQKDTREFQITMLAQFLTGLLFMAIVIVIVIIITTSILTKYYHALIGQAQRDQLTGLRNRTCYEQEMHVYGSRLSDYSKFAIGVFDLNNLKLTNDTLGHRAGDAYLCEFATLLSENFPHCPLFRIGGDEFLAVFINMTDEEITAQWELLKLALKEQSKSLLFSHNVSFGYAFKDSDNLNDIEKIFREADKRMYENKKDFKSFDLETN